MNLPFVKMHGAGNDYVFVDGFAHEVEAPAELARCISDRRRGAGSDGLILILPADDADARMRMFNADGSEAETCGNGLRCVVKYLFDRERVAKSCTIASGAGMVAAEVRTTEGGRASQIALDMGEPRLDRAEVPMTGPHGVALEEVLEIAGRRVPVTAIGMGNPHCVVFVEDIEDHPALEVGTALQASPRFPRSVNVEFVQVAGDGVLRQRTIERGSGETWACGSGAVAAAVAAILLGRSVSPVTVQLRGGALIVEWEGEGRPATLIGPAVEVFEGIWQG